MNVSLHSRIIHLKAILLILVFLLVGISSLSAQTLDIRKFNAYEDGKKELATAYLLTSIFPGAGLYYVDDEESAFLFFLAEMGTAYWYSSALNSPNAQGITVPLLIFIGEKIFEYKETNSAVSDYNSRLRVRLNISYLQTLKSPQVTLQVRF